MKRQKLMERLNVLLSEPLDSVKDRQEFTFSRLVGGLDRPFVLFGASHLGRKVLSVLKKLGYAPVAFIDNNESVWGGEIDSIPVMSPAQLVQQYQSALPSVICTIWSGHINDRMSDRLEPLKKLGFERIALFGHLAWCYPQYFLPHYSLDLPEKVIEDADNIRQAFALLSDEASKQLFVDHIEWRLLLDYDLLPPASTRHIYFDTCFSSQHVDEVVYDIGAFSGDSVEEYLNSGRAFKEIHSFEPSIINYNALQARLTKLNKPNVLKAYQLAIGDAIGETFIEADDGPAARVGTGNDRVCVTTLDELSKSIAPATFIKIDIEGFEPQCLRGGRQLIAELHPVIAVSVYHEQNHLWSILQQLHSYYSDYHFSLCPHVSEGWDLVLYAVPIERVPFHASCE